jgi:crescentin
MSRLASLIGRKPNVEGPASNLKAGNPEADDDNILELDPELFSPIANQLGKDNEVVRNLLIDAEYRISELDAVKQSISKLLEPVGKTLRDFETAKSERLSLQTVLNTTRIAYGKLRTESEKLEKRAESLSTECIRLQEDLSLSQEYVENLETTKTEQAAELTAKTAEIADLQRRLQHDSAELQNTREENRRMSERVLSADKKMVQVEAEIAAARQKATLAERERATTQNTLDEALAEQSRMSHRLVEADNALTAANTRLRQLEASLNETETERARLAQASDAAKEKHLSEINTLRMRFEALNTRSGTTEKLLDEARQTLTARADEIRSYERRMSEATLVRNMVEGKLSQIEAGLAERDAQIRDLDQARTTLTDRNQALTKAVSTRESAFNRAQEKIGSLEERVELLERELKATRDSSELQIEELNTQLHRERVERTMAEGALDSARTDVTRLSRELAVAQNRPVPPEKPGQLPPAPNLRSVA